ncbi:MAG: hypothetical protein ABW292_17040, partial [Vicinamibacterales bacterium]
MYLRQMKQFIRAARPDFDERRYGSLPELLRACQKDGLLRLERDRQGGLRAFAGAARPTNVPHGWASLEGVEPGSPVEIDEASEVADATPHVTPDEPPVTIGALPAGGTDSRDEAEADDQLAMFGAISPMDPEPKVRKARRPASETSKAKRTPVRRAPRTAKVKSDAPRTRRRAGGRGRNEEAE